MGDPVFSHAHWTGLYRWKAETDARSRVLDDFALFATGWRCVRGTWRGYVEREFSYVCIIPRRRKGARDQHRTVPAVLELDARPSEPVDFRKKNHTVVRTSHLLARGVGASSALQPPAMTRRRVSCILRGSS